MTAVKVKKTKNQVKTLHREDIKVKNKTEEAPPVVVEKRYNKVYIVSHTGHPDVSVGNLFRSEKYLVVNDFDNADIVVFTGGHDVSPFLYGQPMHPTTSSSKLRDEYEVSIYNKALRANKFMVGICRGGQFLNVMNGGEMWQDVDGHGLNGTHLAYSMVEELPMPFEVTSTHHQMIRPNEKAARVLLTAYESSRKEDCYYTRESSEHEVEEKIRRFTSRKTATPEDMKFNRRYFEDVESCYYAQSKSFCFQPHPEYYHAPAECVDWFFDVMEMLIKEAYELKADLRPMRTEVEKIGVTQ